MPGRGRGRSERGRGEGGETLVELLVSVAILGLAGTALVGALGTVTGASATHRQLATAETAIRTYAEAVKSAGYRDCRDALTYGAADVRFSSPPGYGAADPVVSYWDGAAFGAGCPAPADPGPHLQLVTLEVHSCAAAATGPCRPDGRASETVNVTVRSP